MDKKGYYFRLIKSEINKEILGEKDFEEINKTKNLEALKFNNFAGKTMKYDTKQESEEDIKFDLNKILELVYDKKSDITIGVICGFICGIYIPCMSLLLGEITTSFVLEDNSKMRSEVIKWSFILLVITIFGIFCNYFKSSKLSNLGSIITSKLRKKLFKKYLELHMGFFDFESNNPNELLSVLSIEKLYKFNIYYYFRINCSFFRNVNYSIIDRILLR